MAVRVSAAKDGARVCEAANNARGDISMGGFFGGLIAGAVVVMASGIVLSLTTPLSRKPEVATESPNIAAAPEPVNTEKADDAGPDADLVELAPRAPQAQGAATDTLDGVTEAGLAPDAQPETGDVPTAPASPSAAAGQPVEVETAAPAAPPSPVAAPQSPSQAVAPEVIAVAPPPPPSPTERELPKLEGDAGVDESAGSPSETAPVPESAEVPADSDAQPDDEGSIQDNPIAVEGDEDTLPRNTPRILTLPQVAADQPSSSGTLVGKRVIPLTERDNAPEEQAAEPVPVPGKPIEDHAAAFENPEGKPLMSIILIDDEGAYGAEALKDFPYPLSFAISPSDPDAAEKMARYRDSGFEVLALADLPESASAQDAEVSLSVWLDTLPETVGILEGVGTGIQGNRKLADQVAAIAGGTGRGLVTQNSGLNTVQKLAARNGVPSSVVFRDFDGARQDATVMRRFLDQAAFRAGQEGAVVMLGRLRPETISALLLWGLEDRGNRVAMAPISAVMMNELQ